MTRGVSQKARNLRASRPQLKASRPTQNCWGKEVHASSRSPLHSAGELYCRNGRHSRRAYFVAGSVLDIARQGIGGRRPGRGRREATTGLLATLLDGGPTPTWSATPIALAKSSSGSELASGVAQVVSSGPGSWSGSVKRSPC